ncbi:phosphatidylinositol 4-kinase gamma 7-like [Humulus lupulus]|uniref:phosphatidylinositol 4-kinase gamma 7-like n=1 Tax=Humulus lupulus TaxID=3486 RepID=UPI002B4027B9|nr:phosphatidylinositol 4-kinase gamma 7-like [Humulus lupulus]XP_062116832.1 phosphatidylinositol 4-kinase gamma 7-like [Humulus lupulus]
MSAKLDMPVRTNMAVAVFNRVRNGECNNVATSGSLSRRRRVFVQTETGCVLGMELEKGDNAHTLKRRLQVALNIPTHESSLTFGDLVLNNDLSAVRNDSPLLLTRNIIHRSSSTPCLSPTGNNPLQQWDQSELVEILAGNRLLGSSELVKDIVVAIKKGVDPIPAQGGLGGGYFFRNSSGETVAIVKPTDEEPFAPNNPKGFVGKALGQPGLKRSVRVGETGFREVAAYLLDYDHFANVPPTVLVKVTHSVFNINDGVVSGNNLQNKKKVSKIASLQQFIPHDFDAGDYGTSSFPVSAVHRIGILDIRIFNTDRHAGNLLVRQLDGIGRFDKVELIPIDHGLCLPENLEDPYFEWIHWPQASIPFSEDELEYINKLDPNRDSEMLQMELPMIRDACLRVLILCTLFLKEAAAFGLCLAEIGEMMSREFQSQEDQPSELEVLCLEAMRSLADWNSSSSEAERVDEEFLFDIDSEDTAGINLAPVSTRNLSSQDSFHKSKVPNGQFLLSKLDEGLEEDDEADVDEKPDKNEGFSDWPNWDNIAPKLCMSQNKADFKKERLCYNGRIGTSSGIRTSANEQQPTTRTFVDLSFMSKEEWVVFLDNFKELLYSAFANRRSATIERRQKLRLGSSCRF